MFSLLSGGIEHYQDALGSQIDCIGSLRSKSSIQPYKLGTTTCRQHKGRSKLIEKDGRIAECAVAVRDSGACSRQSDGETLEVPGDLNTLYIGLVNQHACAALDLRALSPFSRRMALGGRGRSLEDDLLFDCRGIHTTGTVSGRCKARWSSLDCVGSQKKEKSSDCERAVQISVDYHLDLMNASTVVHKQHWLLSMEERLREEIRLREGSWFSSDLETARCCFLAAVTNVESVGIAQGPSRHRRRPFSSKKRRKGSWAAREQPGYQVENDAEPELFSIDGSEPEGYQRLLGVVSVIPTLRICRLSIMAREQLQAVSEWKKDDKRCRGPGDGLEAPLFLQLCVHACSGRFVQDHATTEDCMNEIGRGEQRRDIGTVGTRLGNCLDDRMCTSAKNLETTRGWSMGQVYPQLCEDTIGASWTARGSLMDSHVCGHNTTAREQLWAVPDEKGDGWSSGADCVVGVLCEQATEALETMESCKDRTRGSIETCVVEGTVGAPTAPSWILKMLGDPRRLRGILSLTSWWFKTLWAVLIRSASGLVVAATTSLDEETLVVWWNVWLCQRIWPRAYEGSGFGDDAKVVLAAA
ncbi:hypothetical protein JOM56_003857 [Amanita muscaria]